MKKAEQTAQTKQALIASLITVGRKKDPSEGLSS